MRGVDRQAAHADARGGGDRRRRCGRRVGHAPQHGADARHQLARRERLDDVVVGPELEPDDAIGLVATGREHDDRDRSSALRTSRQTSRPEPSASITSSSTRSGCSSAASAIASGAEPGDAGRVALALERRGERQCDRVLVLDEQDGSGCSTHLVGPS